MEKQGWHVVVEVLPAKRYYLRIIERLKLIRNSEVVLLSKLKLNPLEMLLLRMNAKNIAYDFDDAIYLRRPRTLGQKPQDSWWRRKKFNAMCRHSDLVFAGNHVIADQALKHNSKVVIIPTPVNADAYQQVQREKGAAISIVWIGLPGNLAYLEMVRPALIALQKDFPEMILRVVSSAAPQWDDVNLELVAWNHETEIAALKSSDIGIMPLSDDDWSRGKCAFKLLQYMAAGLPCVASPVGANTEAVLHGVNGFHAETSQQWEDGLRQLLESSQLRIDMGQAGRERVEQIFSSEVVSEMAMLHLVELMSEETERNR